MPAYYYFQGRKVAISLDRARVAVNSDKAAEAGVKGLDGAKQVKLPGGMVVIARADVSPGTLKQLEKAGALQSVYTQGTSTIVPAPELRIEIDSGEQRTAVRHALSSTRIHADIIDETQDRFVVRPKSGSGDDAIDLANEVTEKAHPGMSAARLFHITDSPDVTRR